MAASGDVTLSDGATLHPYLVALVRWCVSCVWSTANVFLHRLVTSAFTLPAITGKPSNLKPRPAGKEHLDPEPKVECVVLHEPLTHNLDVVFVHGLYGSLGNTWRQGEWRSKYPVDPEKIHLRRPTSTPMPCKCSVCDASTNNNEQNSNNENIFNDLTFNHDLKDSFNENKNNDYGSNEFTNIDEKFMKNIKKIIPKDDVFMTEKFYNNTLLDHVEIVDNYETQVQFVRDLFKSCDIGCDENNDNNIKHEQFRNNETKGNGNECEEEINENKQEVNCGCKINEKKCEVGCGCICDECYSPCWPKDWIKVDYPDARIISINYTSDPHLWRPLWIKENKRLRLHERAEQMTQQLLELGVGHRPIVWVGHSKGGLFIKQIYCEAYEAHQKIHKKTNNEQMHEYDQDNIMNMDIENNQNSINDSNETTINDCQISFNDEQNNFNDIRINENRNNVFGLNDVNESARNCNYDIINENMCIKIEKFKNDEEADEMKMTFNEEDETNQSQRSSIWTNSVAFMFYSVPHRGSPLADIKTPVTARSVELQEIAKDCSLVLSLQERWLDATSSSQPLVRSLVETRRTLMSVLWLRIVSTDSADPGIGALCGVSVDHREICKPTSRHCLLYTELAKLIRVALNKNK